MGIKLVREAMSPVWADLSAFARVVLVHMALVAHDDRTADHVPRLFWGGHASIVMFTTGVVEGQPGYDAARKRVQRAIAELIKAGAIVRDHNGHGRSRAVYSLTTNTLRLPVENYPVETVENSVRGAGSGPLRGDTDVPLEGTLMSPISKEQVKEYIEGW